MNEFLHSKKIKYLACALAGLAILLLVFKAGETFGRRRALFGSRWGENYYHNFYGGQTGFGADFVRGNMMHSHGVAGSIMDISGSDITVKDQNNTESSVLVSTSTVIRFANQNGGLTDLKVGQNIVVIGSPNEKAQIDAKLIRVFDSSSTPWGPSFPRMPMMRQW